MKNQEDSCDTCNVAKQTKMKVIQVRFDGYYHAYDYFCRFDLNRVPIGSRVIVESPKTGYTTVTVVAHESGNGKRKASKEIVSLIDDAEYKMRIECSAKLAKLEEEIQERLLSKAREDYLNKMFAEDIQGIAMVNQAAELRKTLGL